MKGKGGSLEDEVYDLTTCLKCPKGKKVAEQIAQNIKKYDAFIKAETDKLPEEKPNLLHMSYCRGAIDQLEDMTTLTKRALLFICMAQEVRNKKLSNALKHADKLKGRI